MKNIATENEAILISSPSNLFYFTDMKNPDAYAVFIGNEKYYFTDERYFEEAASKLAGYAIKSVNELHDFFRSAKIGKLGIEQSSLPHEFCSLLQEDGVQAFYGIDSRINKLRAIKSPAEIELIKKAQEITDKTFEDILPVIREGVSETELAGILESLLYVNGADELSFTSIVAFGENSSKPHAERSDKKLTYGSIITLDFGAKFQNYCSDMTRTVFFGAASDEQRKMYKHVLTAQEMALSIAYSGISAKECDTMARRYFAENGLDKFFIHTLGHGVGIDIHEYPRLAQNSDTVMEDNMVVTIEPGLYFEGKFGIRIEDLIIFDKSGIINLTKSPKNIIIL